MGNALNKYICIFNKKDDPNVCYLCYTDDIDKKLDEINSGIYKDKDFYSLFLKYAVSGPDEAARIFEIIDSINPGIRMENNPNVFKISPNRARDILLKIYGLEEFVSKQIQNVETTIKDDSSKVASHSFSEIDSNEGEMVLSNRQSSNGIAKKDAIKLLESAGFAFKNKNITFASKNGLLNYYWANPHKDVLYDDWYLILNDYLNGMLYVFFIAGMTLTTKDIPVRTDSQKPDCLKISIRYNDKKFTNVPEKNKKYAFKKFLVFSYKYSGVSSRSERNWTDVDSVLSQNTKDVYTLEDEYKIIYGQPTEFYYEGNQYKVTNYRDLIRKTLVVFSSKDKEKIYELGRSKYRPTEQCKKPYISFDKNDIKHEKEIPEFPGLYFNLTLSGDNAIIFIKGLAKEFGIDPKSYSYKIILVPQDHK